MVSPDFTHVCFVTSERGKDIDKDYVQHLWDSGHFEFLDFFERWWIKKFLLFMGKKHIRDVKKGKRHATFNFLDPWLPYAQEGQ